MQVYSNVEIRVDGQLLAESASVTVHDEAAQEREEKELFLTKAMFRVRMRDEAMLVGEPGCAPLDTWRERARPDDPYAQTSEQVLARMWERAQERTGFHVCAECKRREPTTPELIASLDDNYGLHHVHGRGLCGPMDAEPVDAKLAQVLEECTWKARALLRECNALTDEGFPVEVLWTGDEEDEEPIPYDLIIDDPTKDALVGADPAKGADETRAAVASKSSSGSFQIEMTAEMQTGWEQFLGSLRALVPSMPAAEGESLDRLAALYGLQRIRPLVSGPYRGDGCVETDEELRARIAQAIQRPVCGARALSGVGCTLPCGHDGRHRHETLSGEATTWEGSPLVR